MKHVVIWILVGLAMLASLPFLPQVPQNVKALAAKEGRVIDHDSGSPIAGALVIAIGRFSGSFWHSINSCTFVDITRTDEEGRFHFPSEFSHFTFALPIVQPHQSWSLYASKRGYVPPTATFPLKYSGSRSMDSIADWNSDWNPVVWHGMSEEVLPLELMQKDLSIEEEIALFWHSGALDWCGNDSTQMGRRPIVEDFYAEEAREMCADNSGNTVAKFVVQSLWHNAVNSDAFRKAWEALDANAFRSASWEFTRYKMSDVCAIFKAGSVRKVERQTKPSEMVIVHPSSSAPTQTQ